MTTEAAFFIAGVLGLFILFAGALAWGEIQTRKPR